MRPVQLIAASMLALAAPTMAQSSADLEARVRALEERVAALEAGAAQPSVVGAEAIRCKRLNVNGSAITPATILTVTVNGNTVATFDANAYGDLEPSMRPGANRVGLSFAAPGTSGPFGTNAELRCLAPGSASSRDTILTLRPTRERLSAEVEVEYIPG